MKTANEIRNILNAEATRIREPRKVTNARMTAATGLEQFARTATDEELTRFAELICSMETQPA